MNNIGFNKSVAALALVLSFFMLLSGCIPERYVVFQPVIQEGDNLVISEASMSIELKHNVKFVLDYYRVKYKEDSNGNILVPEKVWGDRDLIWNYTTKANDPVWLNSR